MSTFAAKLAGALWRIVLLLALLTIGGVSAALNARFGYLLGEDEVSRWAFMALSIAVDVTKWLLPIAAGLAWRQSAYIRFAACLLLWAWAGFYSFTAAVGFSAYNRDLMSAGRSESLAERTRADTAWKTAQTTLATLQASDRWTSTRACTNATAPQSKTFCAEVETAKQALADADRRLSRLRAVASTDPQAEFWARQFELPLGRVQIALTVLIAVTAELMTMLGFFAVSAPPARAATAATKPREAPETPVEVVLPVETPEPSAKVENAPAAPVQAPPGVVMKRPPPRMPRRTPPPPVG